MMEIAQKLFTCLCICLLLLMSLTLAVDLTQDDDAGISNGYNDETCSHTITNMTGLFEIYANELSGYKHCVWTITVDNASSLHLLLTSDVAGSQKESNNNVTVLVSGRGTAGSGVVSDTLHGVDNYILRTFQGSTIYLNFTLDPSHSASDVEDIHWSVAYIASTQGNFQTCDNSSIEVPAHGIIIAENNTFGSVASLECSEGYTLALAGSSQYAVCTVQNGLLSWISRGAECESVCRHPPQVLHASIHLSVDTVVRFIRPDTKDEGMSSVTGSRVSSRVTNSTVEYTCQPPYQLSGMARLRCSPDTQGVPQWSDSPPSCYIPDCSSRISLRQHSGAMVNPLNPHSEEATLQDSVTCVWEISGPSDAVVSFHIKSFDFPITSGAEIVFTDSGAARPRELLRMSEQGQLQNVTSDTSKVLVTYNGPYARINEDGFGLYVEYIMRSRDSIRQAVTPDDSTTTVSDDAATSLPPTQNAPSSPVPLLSSSTSSQQTTTAAAPVTAAPTTAARTTPTPSTIAGPASREATVSDTTDTVPTMSTTEQPVRSPLPFLSSSTGAAPSVVYSSTTPVVTASGTTPFVAASDESSDDWKIAVGFVVPIVILISVLVGVYICYRKKYPVRMIIGREFGKFSNPQYSRPQRMSTLVRNDAEDYFSNRNSMNVSSEEFNPVNDRILYDNPAFVKDDAEDEEEAERKFRERKSWLFKSSSEEPDSEPKRATDVHAGQSEERKTSTSETDADQDQTDAARKESVLTIDSDISEILSEQKQTPKPKRRNKKEKRTGSSASGSISSHENGADEKSTASELSTDANKEDTIKDEQALAQNGDVTDGNPVITIDKVPDENSSTCMRTAKLLFEQPTFEEVWAEVKARARSMSVDRPNLPSVKPRSSSLIETSKSARRMSLHDEVLLSAHVKRLNALDKTAPLQRSQELPNIYASVVAADVRARQRSFASSVMTDEEDVLETLPLEERERCMSMTSLNSNPHLVTDLDESLSHNDSNDEGDGVTGKWSVGQASDVDDDEDAKAEPALPKSSSKTVPSGNASKTDSERENTTEKDKTSKKKVRQSKSARAKKSSTKVRSDSKSSSQSNQSFEGSEVIQRATVVPLTEASSEAAPENKDSEENDTDQQSDDGFLQRSVINPTSSYVSAVQIVLKSKDGNTDTAAGIADTSIGEDKAEQVHIVDEAKAERTMSQSSQSHSDSNSDKLSWHSDDEKDSGPSPAPFESKTQLNLATAGVAEETSDLHTDAGQNKIKIMHLRDLKAQSDSDAGDDSESKEDDDSGDVHGEARKDNETEEEDDEDFTASGPRKIKFVLPPREHTVSQCSDESVKGSSDDASETDSSEDDMGMTSYDFNAGQDDEQQHEDNSDQSHSDTDSHDKNEEFSALSPKDTQLSSPSASVSASLSASESLNISQAPAAELLTLSETKNKDKYRASSGDHQQIKLIPDVRYSDTSSESSDKEESGEIRVLSARARQDSDETAGDKHAPRRINIGNIDISDDDNEEDDQDNQHKLTDSDLSEILEESNEEDDGGKDKQGAISFDFGAPKTYVFRDENSDDEDIDV